MGVEWGSSSQRQPRPWRSMATGVRRSLAALRSTIASCRLYVVEREFSRRGVPLLDASRRVPGDRSAVLATALPVTGPTHPYLRALWRTELRVASLYAAEPSAPARQVATPQGRASS